MVQAIFFDVDGTLVSFRTHTVSPGVLDALHRLREKGIKLFRLDHHQGLVDRNETFLDHVACDFEGSSSCSLAVSGLQHEQFLFLDREFHILHIMVVFLQSIADLDEILVCTRHDFS